MSNKKILVIKPSALGDIIHTLPAVAAIKKEHDEIFIGWVVSTPFKNLLENSFIDKIHVFERNKWGGLNFFRNFFKIIKFISSIRREEYDVVIDFQGLLRTGLITLFSGGKKKIGFENARELAPLSYHVKVKTPIDVVHAVERYRLLACAVDAKSFANELPISISQEIKKKLDALLPEKYIVIVPGARWMSKRWPPDYFAQLIDKIFRDLAYITIIVGAPGEKEIGESIRKNIINQNAAIDMIGATSLQELCYVLEKACVVVSNDSGPMHLAAAVKTKTIALFGPTDPNKIRPYGEDHVVIKKDNICLEKCKRICFQDLKCLRLISPDEVLGYIHESIQ